MGLLSRLGISKPRDEHSSMQIATMYACVRLLAETIARLPLHLYRYKGNDARQMPHGSMKIPAEEIPLLA